MRDVLAGRNVFISASFPSGERGERFTPYDVTEIADAVTAMARAVFVAGGRLVFGGHPTITPLVFFVASEHRRPRSVDTFQTRWFEHAVPDETRRLRDLGFGEIYWTERLADEAKSLRAMRTEMIERSRPVAGVFVGGMEGIEEEWSLLERLLPGRLRVPVLRPGGAAARLGEEARVPTAIRQLLDTGRYPVLARAIVDAIVSG